MAWSFTNDKPIFQQLVDIITMDIISGKIKSGEKLKAVRELAIEAGVNPNTMQRALATVEESGIIFTKRGDGRYVSEDPDVILKLRNKYVEDKIDLFLESLKSLGLSDREIFDAVKQIIFKE